MTCKATKNSQGLQFGGTMPVLHPVRLPHKHFCPYSGVPYVNFHIWHGVLLIATLALVVTASASTGDQGRLGIWDTLVKWTPLLLSGFSVNLLMSIAAMAIGTVFGVILGLCQISLMPQIRTGSWLLTQIFRNSPWLVTLFYVMYVIPFEFDLFGTRIALSDWSKATFGLSLPVMANVSEIVRGGVQSIPAVQWEAARGLAFNHRQTLWMIILPQAAKRMLPPWMNLYAILTMATVLGNIVGVTEALTLTREIIAAEARTDLLLPLYGYVLLMFFLYVFPISRLTIYLERKWAVDA